MATRTIDTVAKDFDSIVDSLITYASVNYGPETEANRQWVDFNIADFSRTWLELLSYVADLIFYYLDVQATQSTLETATIRSVILNLAAQFGYQVPTATSATGTATFTLSSAQTIPQGFRLASSTGVSFFTTSSSPLPGSTLLSPILPVIQGDLRLESFFAKGVQNEEVILSFTGLVKDEDNVSSFLVSPKVTVNATPYTLVDSFLSSLPTDTHYRVITDQEGRSVLRFGDGIFGNKLSPNDTISVTYRTGGGTVGNIPANTLTTLVDPSTFITSVNNPTAFSGGADEPSSDQLRQIIPASLRTLERAVTLQDYADILLANFSNVSKTSSEINTDRTAADINIYVVPSGSSITPISSNPTLLANLNSFLDKRKAVTTTFEIKDAFGIQVRIALEIFAQSGVSRAEIENSVKAVLQAFFDLESGDIDGTGSKFAQKINLGTIYDLIGTVAGIDRFEIKEFNYIPRIAETSGLGTNYLYSEVKLFENSSDSEWLVAPEPSTSSPSYVPYSVYKKSSATISAVTENSVSDDTLNFSVVDSITSGVNVDGVNLAFDFSKTFKVDEFVGGSSSITLTNVSGSTWDHSGSSFSPKVGDRITQSGNISIVKQIIDSNTFVLSSGTPAALINGAASITRDEFLFIDASNNVWTITDNDSHTFELSAFALNDYTVTDVSAGAYRIVKSLIGATVIIRDSIFDVIEYNTHNTLYRQSSSFNLVGAINDPFIISEKQITQGDFGVPVTVIQLQTSTPNAGLATLKFAGNPDLSLITTGVGNNYVFIDSNGNVFEVYGVDDVAKTITILHQAGTTTNPAFNNSPGCVCPRYYSDDSEISFVLGSANVTTGIGFSATGFINTIPAADFVEGETFTINDGVNPATVFEFDTDASVAGSNVAVDISAAVTADDVKLAIISAINGVALLAVTASNGGTGRVFLQHDQVGVTGNNLITELVADADFVVSGMSGGLSAGANPTPSIPGLGDYSLATGVDSANNVLDTFVFRTSSFADDIINLRNNEIPQIDNADIIFDIRGGVA